MSSFPVPAITPAPTPSHNTDPQPKTSSIPTPSYNPPPNLDFPADIWGIILSQFDLDSLGMLAFTCHGLYTKILANTTLPHHLLNEICAYLIKHEDLAAIKRFCGQIKIPKPVALTITKIREDLFDVVSTVQESLQIDSLTVRARSESERLDVSIDLLKQICEKSSSSLKKLVLRDLVLDTLDLPDMPQLEELEVSDVLLEGADEPKSLTEVVGQFPSLKRLLFSGNEESLHLGVDLEQLESSGNSLEYFSHEYPADCKNWEEYVHSVAETFADETPETVTRGILAYYLGCSSLDTGDTEKGKEFLEKSVQLSPRLIHPQRRLALLFAETDPKEAAERLRACIALYSEDISCLHSLGKLLLQTGQDQEGIELLEKVVEKASVVRTATCRVKCMADIIRDMLAYESSRKRGALLLKKLVHKMPTVSCSDQAVLRYLMREANSYLAAIKLHGKWGYIKRNQADFQELDLQELDLFGQLMFGLRPWNEEIFTEVKKEFLPQFEDEVRKAFQQYSLFSDTEPWICLFHALKKSGKGVRPLLDDLFAALGATLLQKSGSALLEFLLTPEWSVERRHFFSLLSETEELVDKGMLGWFADTVSRGDDLVKKEFYEIVLRPVGKYLKELGDELFSKSSETKLDFFYNAFKAKPKDPDILFSLAEVYVERNEMNKAKRFFERAANVLLSNDKCSHETLSRLHETLSRLQILPDIQQKLATKYPELKGY